MVAKGARKHSQKQILKQVNNALKSNSNKVKQQRGKMTKEKQNDQNLYKTLLWL